MWNIRLALGSHLTTIMQPKQCLVVTLYGYSTSIRFNLDVLGFPLFVRLAHFYMHHDFFISWTRRKHPCPSRHWCLNKTETILQTTFPNAFSGKKMSVFWLPFAEICTVASNSQQIIVGSGYDLVLSSRKAITYTTYTAILPIKKRQLD